MIFGWFGKGRRGGDDARPADPDSRALDLLNSDWKCSCCGETHHGIMELACGSPDHWPHDKVHQPNAMLDRSGDFLSSDFCVLGGESFLVRSILEIPVHGLDRLWAWGCWTSLSRKNFDRYVEHFDENFVTDEQWFGWLCNRLRFYNMEGKPLAVTVLPQPKRQRPKLWVQDAKHPLGRAQREGITSEELLALFRAYGHGPTVQ